MYLAKYHKHCYQRILVLVVAFVFVVSSLACRIMHSHHVSSGNYLISINGDLSQPCISMELAKKASKEKHSNELAYDSMCCTSSQHVENLAKFKIIVSEDCFIECGDNIPPEIQSNDKDFIRIHGNQTSWSSNSPPISA